MGNGENGHVFVCGQKAAGMIDFPSLLEQQQRPIGASPRDRQQCQSATSGCTPRTATYRKKVGDAAHNAGDSVCESGIGKDVENKFSGAHVTYGAVSSGRAVPAQDRGDQTGKGGGRSTVGRDFEGPDGPYDKAEVERRRLGDDNVQ